MRLTIRSVRWIGQCVCMGGGGGGTEDHTTLFVWKIKSVSTLKVYVSLH